MQSKLGKKWQFDGLNTKGPNVKSNGPGPLTQGISNRCTGHQNKLLNFFQTHFILKITSNILFLQIDAFTEDADGASDNSGPSNSYEVSDETGPDLTGLFVVSKTRSEKRNNNGEDADKMSNGNTETLLNVSLRTLSGLSLRALFGLLLAPIFSRGICALPRLHTCLSQYHIFSIFAMSFNGF